jgi:hypothetical protein
MGKCWRKTKNLSFPLVFIGHYLENSVRILPQLYRTGILTDKNGRILFPWTEAIRYSRISEHQGLRCSSAEEARVKLMNAITSNSSLSGKINELGHFKYS